MRRISSLDVSLDRGWWLGALRSRGQNERMKCFLFSFLFVALSASADPKFTYSQLALKDLDQMTALVKKAVDRAHKSKGDAMEELMPALQTVYARPDEDGMIDKIVGPLRSEIEQDSSWDAELEKMVDLSIAVLKDPPKDVKGPMQITHAIILNNVIMQTKPLLKTDEKSRELIRKIRDANIKLTKVARDERVKRTMRETPSPSEFADQALGKSGAESRGDDPSRKRSEDSP